MPKEVPHSAEYVTRKRRHKIWLRVVSSLACLVVFCTTYALILPAITMEETAYCGVEEHQHSDECYTQKLVCQLSEEETGGHVHTEECYQTEQVLSCTLEESQGHTHTEECRQVEELLTCDLPEDETHTHDESCYTQQVTYICGLEESEGHTHTEECYEEVRELICDQEESEPQAHVHDESCYEEVLTCEQEEHTHSLICYSDPTADVETAAVWEKTLPETLTGDWSEDLLAVAQSQLGYTESSRNYTVTEDGEKKGYTRYGDWYGNPYGDWCAMFVSFCLNYAEIPQEAIPYEASCQRWIEALEKEEYNLYRKAGDYAPGPGDLIFFNWDEEPDSDHVGIVTEVIPATEDTPAQVKTIEGNSANQVKPNTYELTDEQIMGYAQLPEEPQEELPEEEQPEAELPEEQLPEEQQPEAEEPEAELPEEEQPEEEQPEAELPEEEQPETEQELTLTAILYEDESYTRLSQEEAVITVTGLLPGDAEVRAYPVNPETEDSFLCAYDISIFLPDGTLYEPAEGQIVTVSIQSPGMSELDEDLEMQVYYLPEEGDPEPVAAQVTEDGAVTFEAEHFSVYAVYAVNATTVNSDATLKNAINSRQASIQLVADFTVSETLAIPANADITLDLNGHTLTVSGTAALFSIPAGTSLTITDSKQGAETVTTASGSLAGNTASLSNGTLTYYVTTTKITNSATGATQESLEKHTVSTSGSIVGGSQPVFQVTGGTLNIQSGMIRGGTGRAIVQTGGTTNLSGGYICGFTQSSGSTDNTSFGGAIRASGGALNLSGTVLAGNTAHNGGAIYATGSTKISITGGIISGNTSNRTTSGWNDHSESGAYRCGGGGIYADGNAELTMSDGYVTNNTATHDGYFDGGGGICLSGTSSMALSGGYVTGNQAQGGGGIRTDFGKETTFVMTGGHVSANVATHAEGGGIAIDRNGVGTVTGGYITNNKIPNTGHWGGGGLFCADGSTLNLKNTLITNNTAGGFGAGVAGCPTGNLYLYVTEGCAIYDNRDTVDGDSPHFTSDGVKQVDKEICTEVFQSNGHADYFCALNSTVTGTMLGGNAANWRGSADYQPVIADAEDLLSATEVMGLKANPTEAAKSAAQAAAKVYINGNYSYTHGGGIMCNGNLVIGVPVNVEVPARIELQATKKLVDGSGNAQSLEENDFSFKVTMTEPDGTVVASGTCDSSGKITFDHQLTFKREGTFVYYVYEETEEGNTSITYDSTLYRLTMTVTRDNGVAWYGDTVKYTYSVTSVKVESSKDGETWTQVSQNNTSQSGVISLPLTSGTTFTNHLIEPTKVTVQKKWEGGTGADSVTVILKKDGEEFERQTLNAGNNWTYTWDNLETGHSYMVEEVPVDGYTANYEITTSTDDSGSTSLGQGSWWVPATELTAGQQYLIVSPDGTKALYISSDHENAAFTSIDVANVSQQTGGLTVNGQTYSTWYNVDDIDNRSAFTAENTTKSGSTGIILKCKGTKANSWLLIQSTSNNHFKSTSQAQYASIMVFENGILRGQENYQWNPDDLRTLIYADGKFNSTTAQNPANAVKLYTLVSGEGFTGSTTDSTTVVITNAKDTVPEYELPETGGPGTTLYTIGGLLLITGAGTLLMYNHTKRRKEDSASS